MKKKHFRDHLPAKEANDLLDHFMAAVFIEYGQEKTAELFEKAKARLTAKKQTK